jgi:glycine oxidase
MRIAVIGAGIIGLATASELVRRGHDVVVVDPDPANGASRAAAGMLAPAAEAAWGQDSLVPLMRASADAYPEFLARLSGASGSAARHRKRGTLSVAVDAADRSSLTELVELQASHGLNAEKMTGSRAREIEPALGSSVTAAVLTANDHQVDPRRVMAALLTELGDRVQRARVVEVIRDTERVVGVRLESGARIGADVVVAAPGLDVGRIEGLPALRLRPVWGDILRLRVPEELMPLLSHTIRASVRGRAVYLVPRDDGTVVLGASIREGGVSGVQAGAVLALLRDAELVVPGVAECEITEMMTRARPGSPDAVPLLGRSEPGLVIATGFDRHGVLLAPLAAVVGADLVEDRQIDPALRAALDPLRFTTAAASTQQEAGAFVGAVTKG